MRPELLGVAVLGLELAMTIAAAIIARPSGARRYMALFVGAAALGCPFLLPLESVGIRGLAGFHASVAFLRIVDLIGDERPWSVARRVWLIMVLVDVRKAKPANERRVFATEVCAIVLLEALSVGAILIALHVPPQLSDGPALAVRWLGALVGFYAGFDAFMRAMTAAHRLAGYQLPPLHRNPVLSKSAGEFWAKRWNLTISDWLKRNCMMPLARRRRPVAAIVAAFTVSGLVHFWQAFVVTSLGLSVLAFAYFLFEGVVVVAERHLRVQRWPAPIARVWTILLVAGPSPLLMEPLMRVAERL